MYLTVALAVFVCLSSLRWRAWEAAVLTATVPLAVFVCLASLRLT
jgi:hypothetical protein